MFRRIPLHAAVAAAAIILCVSARADSEQPRTTSIAPPPGSRLVQQFSLAGPLLAKVKTQWPRLSGVQDVLIQRYRLGHVDKKADAQQQAFQHYAATMKRLGWYPLIDDSLGQRQSAAYSSPNGDRLLSVSVDPHHMVVGLVTGHITLDQIPELERVIVQMLVPGWQSETPEVRAALDHADQLVQQNQRDQAIQVLTDALKASPRSIILHHRLAELYAQAGRHDDQIAQLKAIVALGPDAYQPRVALARALYESKKDYNSALFEFAQAAALAPDQGTPRYFIARIYEDMGRYNEALQYYQRAGELAPHWVSIPLRMGGIYERQGDPARAAAAYRKALQIRPDCSEARKALDKITGPEAHSEGTITRPTISSP